MSSAAKIETCSLNTACHVDAQGASKAYITCSHLAQLVADYHYCDASLVWIHPTSLDSVGSFLSWCA